MINLHDHKKLYAPEDPEMRLFGTVQNLAQQRHRGQGAAYIKVGRSIRYQGSDLDKYLNENRVTTKDMPN